MHAVRAASSRNAVSPSTEQEYNIGAAVLDKYSHGLLYAMQTTQGIFLATRRAYKMPHLYEA